MLLFIRPLGGKDTVVIKPKVQCDVRIDRISYAVISCRPLLLVVLYQFLLFVTVLIQTSVLYILIVHLDRFWRF